MSNIQCPPQPIDKFGHKLQELTTFELQCSVFPSFQRLYFYPSFSPLRKYLVKNIQEIKIIKSKDSHHREHRGKDE